MHPKRADARDISSYIRVRGRKKARVGMLSFDMYQRVHFYGRVMGVSSLFAIVRIVSAALYWVLLFFFIYSEYIATDGRNTVLIDDRSLLRGERAAIRRETFVR